MMSLNSTLAQPAFPGFCQVEEAVATMAAAGTDMRGAVFTRREVADFILDLVDYTTDQPLHRCRLLEPSMGQGDFLLPVIDRLFVAYNRATAGQDKAARDIVADLTGCICAVELHHVSYEAARNLVGAALETKGLTPAQAGALCDHWLIQGDFLLIPLVGPFTHVIGNPPYVRQEMIFIAPFDALDVEPDRKLPIAMTRDILTGTVKWRGFAVINPFGADGKLVPLKDYPKMAAYLERHGAAIKERHVSKKNPNSRYRTIDRIYPELTAVPKLLIPDIKGEAHIVYEPGKLYPHHNLYFITADGWMAPGSGWELSGSGCCRLHDGDVRACRIPSRLFTGAVAGSADGSGQPAKHDWRDALVLWSWPAPKRSCHSRTSGSPVARENIIWPLPDAFPIAVHGCIGALRDPLCVPALWCLCCRGERHRSGAQLWGRDAV